LGWEAIPDEEAMLDLLRKHIGGQQMLYVYSSAWLQSWQLARYSIHAALGQPVSSPAMVQDD